MTEKNIVLPILKNYEKIPAFKNNGKNEDLYKILGMQAKKIDEELKEFKETLKNNLNYEMLYESLDLLQATLSIIDILYSNCDIFDYILLEHKTKLQYRDWKYKGSYEIKIKYDEVWE